MDSKYYRSEHWLSTVDTPPQNYGPHEFIQKFRKPSGCHFLGVFITCGRVIQGQSKKNLLLLPDFPENLPQNFEQRTNWTTKRKHTRNELQFTIKINF